MADPSTDSSARTTPTVVTVEVPPTSVIGILKRLGPGLIIAGSIVGSGELIATTKTGAEAGISLLWLIIIGCVIKVFAQIEFGRYSITTGRTTMQGLDEVPGPRFRVSWLVWYWVIMFACSTGQLGGIVGVVGQSLAIPFPITGDVNALLDKQDQFDQQERAIRERLGPVSGNDALTRQNEQIAAELGSKPTQANYYTYDDVYWCIIVTIFTAGILSTGRYGLVQTIATFLVASFTAVTVFNVVIMQTHSQSAIRWEQFIEGLSFQLPEAVGGRTPIATALATFGIIGVGAAELIAYPYWCLEKGYARSTGPRDDTDSWAHRARGWMHVMHWDAWCSMVVYTFATIAFYMLGAGILHRRGLNPSNDRLVHTLSQMYDVVFGPWAMGVFLFGACTVLFSTFFVANAGNARIAADAVRVFKMGGHTEADRKWWVRMLCTVLPFCSLAIYLLSNKSPVTLVMLSGLAQAVMLPMLGGAALFFRYRRCDVRVCPKRLWDFLLWLSFVGMLISGTWGVVTHVQKLM